MRYLKDKKGHLLVWDCKIIGQVFAIGVFPQRQLSLIKDWSQRVTQGRVQPDWGYFEWIEQIISINPYKLIHFFYMILKNILISSK